MSIKDRMDNTLIHAGSCRTRVLFTWLSLKKGRAIADPAPFLKLNFIFTLLLMQEVVAPVYESQPVVLHLPSVVPAPLLSTPL